MFKKVVNLNFLKKLLSPTNLTKIKMRRYNKQKYQDHISFSPEGIKIKNINKNVETNEELLKRIKELEEKIGNNKKNDFGNKTLKSIVDYTRKEREKFKQGPIFSTHKWIAISHLILAGYWYELDDEKSNPVCLIEFILLLLWSASWFIFLPLHLFKKTKGTQTSYFYKQYTNIKRLSHL